MLSNVVECRCGTLVCIHFEKVKCPNCSTDLYVKQGESCCFVNEKCIPLLIKYKFYPSALNYFAGKYPEYGEKIMTIRENAITNFNVIWTKELETAYENKNYKESKIFAWKII